MIFTATKIPGAFLIDLERQEDDRGFFARSFCASEFKRNGLKAEFVQDSISFNPAKGTLRGMHYQGAPHEEAKIVRCTRGAIYDVLVDVRPASPAFRQWLGCELTAENRRSLYVPEGCAHGFQTLGHDAEVFYQISEFYHPECARGVRWNDPAFGIQWPWPNPVISARDQGFPDWGNPLLG